MIRYDVEQGTPEWHRARAGVITASNFEECCKRMKSGANKGGFSQAAQDYAFRLAVERISGEPLDEAGFDTYAMRRGRELECIARSMHEVKKGIVVDETGFISDDARRFGASADGLIGDDGGSEYKCYIDPHKIRDILIDGDISVVNYQIQGGLWISGRLYWDFGLYCPALEKIERDFTLFTVERDEEFISNMKPLLYEFNDLVEQFRMSLLKK